MEISYSLRHNNQMRVLGTSFTFTCLISHNIDDKTLRFYIEKKHHEIIRQRVKSGCCPPENCHLIVKKKPNI